MSHAQAPLIPLNVRLDDKSLYHIENERAVVQFVVTNPSDKFIRGKIHATVSSVPPTPAYTDFTAEFPILPHTHATVDMSTLKMWSGSWQIVARVTGNETQLPDGSIVSLAYGELDHSFHVYSYAEIVGIAALIVAIIGLPTGYLALRKGKGMKPVPDAVPLKTVRDVMADSEYREHSKVIGMTIFHVWEGSTGQLTSFSYDSGELIVRPPQPKTSKEYPLIDDARRHIEIAYPEVLQQAKIAEAKATELSEHLQSTFNELENRIMSRVMSAAGPHIPIFDRFDHSNLHGCYKKNLIGAIIDEVRLSPTARSTPTINRASRSIPDENGVRHNFNVFELRLGSYVVASSASEEELDHMKMEIQQLLKDKSFQGMAESFFTELRTAVHSGEAEKLHEMTRKIANDSVLKPIEGAGCCSTCAWLFEDIKGFKPSSE